MMTVFMFIAVWAAAAVIVVVKAAAVALAIYFIILFFAWLWDRADEKIRKRGRRCQ